MRLRRWRRRLVAAGLALAALCGAGAASAVGLAASRPGWWREISPNDPGALLRARAVENGTVTLLTQARGNEAWTVRLADTDAAAWLACRLSEWATSQGRLAAWPAELSQVQVLFEDGAVLVSAEVRLREGGTRVFSARLRPTVDAAGALWLRASSVGVGRLRLPAGLMLAEGPEGAPGRWLRPDRALADGLPGGVSGRDVTRVLLGDVPLARLPALRLADGRRVRVLGVRVVPGFLELTCRTEPTPRGGRAAR